MQVKVEELRVGNFLTRSHDNNVVCIVNFGVIKDVELCLSHTYEPILLTKDWLIKLGFELNDDEGDIMYFQLGLYGVKIEEDTDFYFYKGQDIISTLKEINYVHQLQNIFFSLTDEELIKQS